MLQKILPVAEICCDLQPDEVVAMGAAYYAYSLVSIPWFSDQPKISNEGKVTLEKELPVSQCVKSTSTGLNKIGPS